MPGPARRVTPSDLKKTKKALKKAIRKEHKRRDTLMQLRRETDELHGELMRMQNDRNFPFECC